MYFSLQMLTVLCQVKEQQSLGDVLQIVSMFVSKHMVASKSNKIHATAIQGVNFI